MAKKHLIQYYLEQQNLYLEMIDNLKDFNDLLAERKITDEEYQQGVNEINQVKQYYEWLSYIMLLLNKPARKDAKEDKITQKWYNALQGVSKEALLDESRDALADFKELVRKGKLNG